MTDETEQPGQPVAGWYPDPAGTPLLRWWHGDGWTDSLVPHPDSLPQPEHISGGPAPTPPDTRSRDRRRRLVFVLSFVAIALVAFSVLYVVDAVRPRLDTDHVELQIGQDIANREKVVVTVVCPDSVEIRAGAMFRCSVAAEDGRRDLVLVTQNDADGDVTWAYTQ